MIESDLNVLITGAGSGLGRGIANCLAAKKHRLFLVDLNQDGLHETAGQVGHEIAVPITADITSAAHIKTLFDTIGDERIDVLINNAGLQHVSPIVDLQEEHWIKLIDVLLKGPFLMSKAVLPRMRAHGFGRIINIGSIHSLIASPFKSAYTAAKHGLLGFSKAIALESAGSDITVNTICPAYVRTPLVDKQIAAQVAAHGISEQEVIEKIMLEPMPKKVFITVEEVAAAAEFLMSNAARNITGQTIVIDGGWTAR